MSGEYARTAILWRPFSNFKGLRSGSNLAGTQGMTFVADPLVHRVIGCAITVHRELRPGLLESTYARCFRLELAHRRIRFSNEVWLPIVYRGTRLDNAYRMDLVVDDWLVVEVKSVDKLLPVHTSQLLTYLRLARAKQGLLINFNHPRLKDGIKSVLLSGSVSSLPSDPSTDEEE